MNSEPEWNFSEKKTDACILGLRKSKKINSETNTEKTQTEKMLVNNDLDRNKKVGQTKLI